MRVSAQVRHVEPRTGLGLGRSGVFGEWAGRGLRGLEKFLKGTPSHS